MTTRTPAPAPPGPFTPVPTRRRRADGWTPERQVGFIDALAATANVQAACKAVGMSATSAYELRARPDAASFREAWGIALDYAVHRLGEAALDRALNGTATPVFFQGEQVGERRRYDERLAMFILQRRDPQRFGAWRDAARPWHADDAPALMLQAATARVAIAAGAAQDGRAPPVRAPLPRPRMLSRREEEALEIALAELTIQRHEAEEERRRAARLAASAAYPDE